MERAAEDPPADASPPAPPSAAEARTGAARPAVSRGYYAIAHRAGNNLHALEEALATGVDAIECDFWHARGRLHLRHERKLPGIPVLYDRWYVRWSWGDLNLRELLREINFRSELFLDIKSSTPRAADAVIELYRDNASMMPRTRLSSQRWKLLDRIARAHTEMDLFYSVSKVHHIAPLLRRAAEDCPPDGTSIRHTLLSPDLVRRLHDTGLRVYAWTVNNPHRAHDLLDWGVDGLISDNLEVLRLRRKTT